MSEESSSENSAQIVSFGEWVQLRRNRLGLSRTQLAGHVSCSAVTIKKIERDERQPSVQIAQLLATHLQIPPSEQEDFIRRARGEYVANFLSPVEMSLARADTDDDDGNDDQRPHNLPQHLSSFIGRESEIRELTEVISNSECRLLTIIGEGGMGKTRLSIATAEILAPAFTDGILFVALASIQKKTDANTLNPIVGALADELKMTFFGDRPPETQLIDYLRRKEMLLVVDNFEHLVEEADFISHLLVKAPDIKVLATSRERLNLSEEWLFPLKGLALPKSAADVDSQMFSAIDLFNQRAKQVNLTFDGQSEASHIYEICQLVAGMPLGIELAASWVSQLSCAEIVAEIKREVDFLSSDLRNIPERHRSMRAVFASSWQRLTDKEKAVLQKLSVFRGGFEREAATQITAATLSNLAALVNKSMIRRNASGRYEIHELMRQFAAEKLNQDPAQVDQVVSKHGSYYLEFVINQHARLHTDSGQLAMPALRLDIDNIRAAWAWGVSQKLVEPIFRVGYMLITTFDALGWYLEMGELSAHAYKVFQLAGQEESDAAAANELEILSRTFLAETGYALHRMGQLEQGIAIIEKALDNIEPITQKGTWILTMTEFMLALVIQYFGDFARVKKITEDVASRFHRLDDPHNQSVALYAASLAANAIGDYTAAEELAQQSYQVAVEMGSNFLTFYSLRSLGKNAISTGNYQQAEIYLTQSFDISLKHGFTAQSMLHLNELGDAARLQGNFKEAKRYYERSFAISSEMNSPTAMASTYWGLGNLALQQGQHERAKSAFAKSRQTSNMAYRSPSGPGWALLGLGETQAARKTFQQDLEKFAQLKQAPRAIDALAGLAHVSAQSGQLEQALELIVFLEQHSAAADESKARLQQLKEELMAELAPEKVNAAISQGQRLELWSTVAAFLEPV